AARFTNRGNTYTAVRSTDANGLTSYHRADDTSMRKAFIRSPVEFARISSRFNPGRRQPVLNKIRAHKGVDYAASTATPIKVSSSVCVNHGSHKVDYSNSPYLKHSQTYQIIYVHISTTEADIRGSSNVSQG